MFFVVEDDGVGEVSGGSLRLPNKGVAFVVIVVVLSTASLIIVLFPPIIVFPNSTSSSFNYIAIGWLFYFIFVSYPKFLPPKVEWLSEKMKDNREYYALIGNLRYGFVESVRMFVHTLYM